MTLVWTVTKTYLAALESEFFAFGAFGSDTKDLAARRSLLDAVDVFFRFRTRESLAESSCNYRRKCHVYYYLQIDIIAVSLKRQQLIELC